MILRNHFHLCVHLCEVRSPAHWTVHLLLRGRKVIERCSRISWHRMQQLSRKTLNLHSWNITQGNSLQWFFNGLVVLLIFLRWMEAEPLPSIVAKSCVSLTEIVPRLYYSARVDFINSLIIVWAASRNYFYRLLETFGTSMFHDLPGSRVKVCWWSYHSVIVAVGGVYRLVMIVSNLNVDSFQVFLRELHTGENRFIWFFFSLYSLSLLIIVEELLDELHAARTCRCEGVIREIYVCSHDLIRSFF